MAGTLIAVAPAHALVPAAGNQEPPSETFTAFDL